MDEIPHIFCKIQVFPVTEVEASLIFNTLDWVNRAVRIQFRRHLHIVDRADHDGIAGNSSELADLNAGSLQQNIRLDIVGGKKLFLYSIHIVARAAGDELLIFSLTDFNRGSGWNPPGQIGVAAG